jgi:hypothetical protein
MDRCPLTPDLLVVIKTRLKKIVIKTLRNPTLKKSPKGPLGIDFER